MKAAIYREFAKPLTIEQLPDPSPPHRGVVIGVRATGLCRSDWHAWMGHDPGIRLPHVPGHELAGVIEAVGPDVAKWKGGERVTLPFVCGCGECPQCATGNQQVCDRQFQPGFTHWGSFAEYVAIDYADVNLVRLPDELDFVTAASLGCRFATSFRAIVEQGQVAAGQWIAVHGCGGVGLSAIMIATALEANVVAIDIDEEKLAFAKSIGAVAVVNASQIKSPSPNRLGEGDRHSLLRRPAQIEPVPDGVGIGSESVAEHIMHVTNGGAHVSMDALGSPVTCANSIAGLRKRGKHLQVGLMLANESSPRVPMDRVIADELEILGVHGMQAHRYPQLLAMISAGKLAPEKLIGRTISLEESLTELPNMNSFRGCGVTVIDRF